jgi:hypothetical protein
MDLLINDSKNSVPHIEYKAQLRTHKTQTIQVQIRHYIVIIVPQSFSSPELLN